MRFIELKVGESFTLVREQDDTLVYTKINENKHNNATYDNGLLISVHGCSQVKVVR